MVKTKESEGNYSFVKNIIFEIVSHNFNFNKIFVGIIFSYYFVNFVGLLWNLCVQISGPPGVTSLPFISFIRRLITTTLMTSKKTQVAYVNKGSDKIVIIQSTHNNAMGPMTHSKEKSTYSLSKKKKKSEPICLLKPVRTHDRHKPFITLAFLGAKGHSPHSRRKLPSTLKNFGNKSPYPITDANSNTDSHSRSPLKWQRRITTPIIPNLLLLYSWWLCR